VLITSLHELERTIGRPHTGQVSIVLGKLTQAGYIERLPGKGLRLRLCGPFPAADEHAPTDRRSLPIAERPTQSVLAQVRAYLSTYPPGTELRITVKQLVAAIGRGSGSVVRALQTLEEAGIICRTTVGWHSTITILAPTNAPSAPPLAPARTTPLPTLPPAQRLTPHAALWQHLRASRRHRTPADWLLSGVTITVLADTTVLTCADATRTNVARAWHRTLAHALRALDLPHTLVIQQAPAGATPALPPGALDAALEARSVDGLLDALRPLRRLTEEQARALLAQVQAGQAAQERQEAIQQPNVDLAQAITRGYAAWERLILGCLRLIVSIARQCRSPRLSEDEVVQAGMLGLMQAVAQCDGRLTLPFDLFAYRAAHRAIHKALEATRPLRCTSSQGRVIQAQRQLAVSLGREPTPAEIAQQVRLRVSTVLAALDAEGGIASLDAPLRADESGTLAELVSDMHTGMPEDMLLVREEAQERRAALGSALAGLEPDERRVLALRFGLEGEARGVTEVARAMGWTVPRVQRVEGEALTALRARLGASTEGAYR
jgi:RNA polymerase sigma factor (sigma-70 family)